MRGSDRGQGSMFSYVSLEARIPADHPLRPMRSMVDEALKSLSRRFSDLYAKSGRPSIAPERLLRALLLQVLYSIRSERLLMEQLEYNLLFRWFVGLGIDDPVWVPTVFTKNRDRLLEGEVAEAFFEAVLGQGRDHGLLSSEHFTVDGTLIEAWASQKSFRRKDGGDGGGSDDDSGNPTVDFRGERRRNETHASTTDPEARLSRKKGQTSQLAYMGHLLTENRNGLIVSALLTEADGYAERLAALEMVEDVRGERRITLGADRGFDTEDFVAECRERNVTPHVAQNTTNRASRIDGRTLRHPGYEISQRKRKRIEECFGWMKTIGLMRKTRHKGTARVGWMFVFTAAVYNLVRIRNLVAAP
ncbi:MAG: IS5 family transposase [Actinobacteria bacterium]|nr:IS5 family transposase [Actinomycetota bacterium]